MCHFGPPYTLHSDDLWVFRVAYESLRARAFFRCPSIFKPLGFRRIEGKYFFSLYSHYIMPTACQGVSLGSRRRQARRVG